jgi:hypothetical protein
VHIPYSRCSLFEGAGKTGIATDRGLDGRRVGVRVSVVLVVYSGSGAPEWVPCASSPGVKQPGHEAVHLPVAPSPRMHGFVHHSAVRFLGVVRN